MKLRILLTGATGMVGEGVLHECLNDPEVGEVVSISRKPCGHQDQKLKEIIHADFYELSPIADKLSEFDACIFCLGVSSVGMSEDEYKKKTFDLTLNFATLFAERNPLATFVYVSGTGTNSTERSRTMWARVKGRTENALKQLPFKAVFLFRPGYLHPTPGLKHTLKPYKYIAWLYPALKVIFPKYVTTLSQLGRAMLNAIKKGYSSPVLEVKDILVLAGK